MNFSIWSPRSLEHFIVPRVNKCVYITMKHTHTHSCHSLWLFQPGDLLKNLWRPPHFCLDVSDSSPPAKPNNCQLPIPMCFFLFHGRVRRSSSYPPSLMMNDGRILHFFLENVITFISYFLTFLNYPQPPGRARHQVFVFSGCVLSADKWSVSEL